MSNNEWWLKSIFPKRHDGQIFDLWDGKYPSFTMTRKEQIIFYIRLIKYERACVIKNGTPPKRKQRHEQ